MYILSRYHTSPVDRRNTIVIKSSLGIDDEYAGLKEHWGFNETSGGKSTIVGLRKSTIVGLWNSTLITGEFLSKISERGSFLKKPKETQ